MATQYVDDETIIVNLKQSHSFLQGFVNDVPVTDKRDFKTQFLLKSGQLVPLFNLSTLLNSRSKKETIPFLSYFLPGKVDDDNSSYQVFLRFNFGFKDSKTPKPKKIIIPKVEVKDNEVIDLLAIDFDNNLAIESIEELELAVSDELKELDALDLKLETVDN